MIHGELIVDNFAGGGGASTGIAVSYTHLTLPTIA